MQKTNRPCPICNSNKYRNLFSGDRYGLNTQTAECKKCGFVYSNPIELEGFFNEFYRSDYRKFYKKKNNIPSPEYISLYKLKERAIHHVEWIAEYVELDKIENFLDVGCAEGSLLNEFRLLQPSRKFIGVEPDVDFSGYAVKQGFRVHGKIEDVDALKDSKTLVTMSHVLEHVYDLDKMFKSLRQKFAPGFNIYISVPDLESYSGIKDLHIAHIYHFSKISLTQLLLKHGFKILAVEKHRPEALPDSLRIIAVDVNVLNDADQIRYQSQKGQFFKVLKNTMIEKASKARRVRRKKRIDVIMNKLYLFKKRFF
jgi:SAM-dependent methyltransferase